ncbi:LysM peptidoglycan-binding domain-containing protein [Psychrobacter sp. S1-30-MNA-CIBAN-0213]|uniref:LysM peptidoglycan-binding domain-containing protein n=1 Tax=unclassified Psychrobacter TaxID=196806 RepID=UPI00331E79B5
MNFSRQALLGIGMIIGGSVMLYAMVQQIGTSDKPATPAAIVEKSSTEQTSTAPLTTDIDTEKRILAQKQKERAARVAEQEKRAQQFLAEQESAEAQALAKSRAENQQYVANSLPAESDSTEVAEGTTVATPTVQLSNDTTTSTANDKAQKAQAAEQAAKQAEAKKLADNQKQAEAKKQAEAEAKKEAQAAAKKEADAKKKAEEQAAAKKERQAEEKAEAEAAKTAPPKSPADYTVKRGDGLIKLARQYNMPVEALAQANDISSSTSLRVGQELTIPSRKQIERLEREAAAAKKSADAKREAQQKLREARQEVKETDAKGSFGVQVALASNQASADDVAKKFKSAGYQVKTSTTSRGVRVVVGPERGKVAALALKDKINTDPQVDTSGAWVLYWR